MASAGSQPCKDSEPARPDEARLRELRQLTVRLLQSQDEERRRISRDLHDGIGQLLATLAIRLSMVQEHAAGLDSAAREALSEGLRLAECCSADVRALSYFLHPPLLEEGGLGSALRWFADAFAQQNGIRLDVEISPALVRLPRDMELALFRIVQECLTNIQRHSGSRVAGIRIDQHNDEVRLEVWDKGGGMPAGVLRRGTAAQPTPRIGILGMRERARQIHASLEINSGPRGTTVRTVVRI